MEWSGSGAAAVVLAAGASRRLGQPKALVSIGGQSNLAHQVHRLHHLGLKVVVVLGEDLCVAAEGLPCGVALNPDPEAGRTGSLIVGLSCFATLPQDVVVCPVDRPGWNEAVVARLLATAGEAVVPRSDGRRGHPMVLRGEALRAVMNAPPATPLRDLLPSRVEVDVEAPFLHLNLDRPEDLLHIAHLEAWLADGQGP